MRIVPARRHVILLVGLVLLLGTVIDQATSGRIMGLVTSSFSFPLGDARLGDLPPAAQRHTGAAANGAIVGVQEASSSEVRLESEALVAASSSTPSSSAAQPIALVDEASASRTPGQTAGASTVAASTRGVNPFVTSLLNQLGWGGRFSGGGASAGTPSGLALGSTTGAGSPHATKPVAVGLLEPQVTPELTSLMLPTGNLPRPFNPGAGPHTDVGVLGEPMGSGSHTESPALLPSTAGLAAPSVPGAESHLDLGLAGESKSRAADPDALPASTLLDLATSGSHADVVEFVSTYDGSESSSSREPEAVLRAQVAQDDSLLAAAGPLVANPEPRSLLLLGTGLLGLILWQRGRGRPIRRP